jgi:hypothetical protein
MNVFGMVGIAKGEGFRNDCDVGDDLRECWSVSPTPVLCIIVQLLYATPYAWEDGLTGKQQTGKIEYSVQNE